MRWLKFYAVGALGFAVQLGVMAALVRVLDTHYQLATALSVEVSVLHNFLWHRWWTWADRRLEDGAAGAALVRFHLSNGLISLGGNLFFMHLFVGILRVDAVAGALLSIVPCAFLNFIVANRWVFIARKRDPA